MPQAQDLQFIGPVSTTVRGAQQVLEDLWARTHVEMRAFTGNIITLTEKKHLNRVEEALDRLGGRYAGRQIIGVMDGDESVEVTASLVPQRGLYVERLVLDANPEQLQGAILPLLRPATINHVWWGSDEPPGGALLEELGEIANQVIVDTLSLGIQVDQRFTLADLGWARTSGWREALAQLFDTNDAVSCIPQLTRLHVTHAGLNNRPAKLFAGWVASKLGWLDLTRVHVAAATSCVRESGDLCSVTLEGEGVHFRLYAHQGQAVHAEIRYGEVLREMELSVRTLNLSEGLGFVMSRPEQNDSFLDALAVARRFS